MTWNFTSHGKYMTSSAYKRVIQYYLRIYDLQALSANEMQVLRIVYSANQSMDFYLTSNEGLTA